MRILLVDDHALFRHGLHLILAELGQSVEILEFEHLESALRSAPLGIDMVLLEPRGGESADGLPGLEAVRAARECFPKAQIVVVSANEDPAFVLAVFEHGAVGFIPKSSTPKVLLSALRLVRVGGIYVPRLVLDMRHQGAQSLVPAIAAGPARLWPVEGGMPVGAPLPTAVGTAAGPSAPLPVHQPPGSLLGGQTMHDGSGPADVPPQADGSSAWGEELRPDERLWHETAPGLNAALQPVGPSAPIAPAVRTTAAAPVTELTARQRQVLTLLVQGLSNKAIARHLAVSESTVKQHLSTSFKLLGVSNRTQAVYRSAELGLTPVGRQN